MNQQTKADWQALLKASQQALRAGDLAASREALDTAFVHAPKPVPTALVLQRADWLAADEGRPAAIAYLESRMAEAPGDPWRHFRIASLSREEEDIPGAWAALGRALALETGKPIAPVRLLAAELWKLEGDTEKARACLRGLAQLNTEDFWGLIELARLDEEAKAFKSAAANYEEAIARGCDRKEIRLALINALRRSGATERAQDMLEAELQAEDFAPELSLRLLREAHAGRDKDRSARVLAEALKRHPDNRPLLRHAFATANEPGDGEIMTEVVALLKDRVPEDLATELEVQAHCTQLQFSRALEILRQTKRSDRAEGEAVQMLHVLFGARHFKLGWRYLRFCARKWPEHPGFLRFTIHEGLKLGETRYVDDALKAWKDRLPENMMLNYRFLQHTFRNDFDSALAVFEQMLQAKSATVVNREVMAKMCFAGLDPFVSEALFERIGHPLSHLKKPLHRGGLSGQMMLEFELERNELLHAGVKYDRMEWARRRPHSTMAAIRVLDRWCADRADPRAPEGEAIPRKIHQYWNDSEPPEDVAALMTSWSDLEGFEHQVLNRREALAYLRGNFGKNWVRAFQLAHNAAQEADLLRMAILVYEGGIWADADDLLIGDLGSVLGENQGLIAYREPQSGALGNNFIAAAPKHPVLVRACELALQATLARDNEIAWSKTGPGLFTRAMAHFLARDEEAEVADTVTVLGWGAVAPHIAMHNRLAHKLSDKHWNPVDGSAYRPVWEGLKSALVGDAA